MRVSIEELDRAAEAISGGRRGRKGYGEFARHAVAIEALLERGYTHRVVLQVLQQKLGVKGGINGLKAHIARSKRDAKAASTHSNGVGAKDER